MEQKGDQSNNTQMDSAGSRNTFNIHQNQHSSFWEKTIYFKDDPTLKVKKYENSRIKRIALPTLISVLSVVILFVVGLASDLIGIFSYFGFANFTCLLHF